MKSFKARIAAGATAAALAVALTAPAALADNGTALAVDDSIAVDNSERTTFSAYSQNVIGSIETGDATQNGDATATATDGSAAFASVETDLDTSVDVVNGFYADADYDGVLDLYDAIILYGDFDNNGFLDAYEYH